MWIIFYKVDATANTLKDNNLRKYTKRKIIIIPGHGLKKDGIFFQ